ncbi:hypothetical protein AYX22_19955 [Arthrobacter sp. D5-1]|nr:hypothetical protein AYX22_01140 [Arthrobacter sp. D5-1]QSZ47159.1 hypothetical protein AYX22_01180 [Arthrobacter sp. D5-1]QSZ47815.1 hypothetical protein AYX22_04920 [Arthrobacter sp. D5-1]QSZ48474.1 hypothetical protein AYX22_08680 [Arthrobacter sp. D5-1]QSZ50443.1 hypothetical protein AYX22_19925 [Arthrobacter sp. D5-1]
MQFVVVVSVAHCAGVCSAVGAHGWNINESNLFGMAFTGCVLVPVRQHVSLLFVGVGVVGNAAGVHGLWGLCLAHCWVLRQQDLFAAMQRASFWCFFCSCFRFCRVSLCGVVVVWLMGLLFENYIVDASI